MSNSEYWNPGLNRSWSANLTGSVWYLRNWEKTFPIYLFIYLCKHYLASFISPYFTVKWRHSSVVHFLYSRSWRGISLFLSCKHTQTNTSEPAPVTNMEKSKHSKVWLRITRVDADTPCGHNCLLHARVETRAIFQNKRWRNTQFSTT